MLIQFFGPMWSFRILRFAYYDYGRTTALPDDHSQLLLKRGATHEFAPPGLSRLSKWRAESQPTSERASPCPSPPPGSCVIVAI